MASGAPGRPGAAAFAAVRRAGIRARVLSACRRGVIVGLAASLALTAARFKVWSAAAPESLAGQLLVAAEEMADPRFAETVILMVQHDDGGALGLIINREVSRIGFAGLLEKFNLADQDLTPIAGDIALHFGGPVQLGLPFVVHSTDVMTASSRGLAPDVAVSMDQDLLRAIVIGRGPRHSLLTLGYAGWAPGQLEAELARDDWVVIPTDSDLVFGPDQGSKWRRALAREEIAL